MEQEIDYAKLGLRIKELRIKKGLTQDNLAELVGCNTSHISNIENNHTKVSLNVLLSIANTLNTSIDYLLANQYDNSQLALDNEILRAIKDCDNQKKRKNTENNRNYLMYGCIIYYSFLHSITKLTAVLNPISNADFLTKYAMENTTSRICS